MSKKIILMQLIQATSR